MRTHSSQRQHCFWSVAKRHAQVLAAEFAIHVQARAGKPEETFAHGRHVLDWEPHAHLITNSMHALPARNPWKKS